MQSSAVIWNPWGCCFGYLARSQREGCGSYHVNTRDHGYEWYARHTATNFLISMPEATSLSKVLPLNTMFGYSDNHPMHGLNHTKALWTHYWWRHPIDLLAHHHSQQPFYHSFPPFCNHQHYHLHPNKPIHRAPSHWLLGILLNWIVYQHEKCLQT